MKKDTKYNIMVGILFALVGLLVIVITTGAITGILLGEQTHYEGILTVVDRQHDRGVGFVMCRTKEFPAKTFTFACSESLWNNAFMGDTIYAKWCTYSNRKSDEMIYWEHWE